MLFQALLTYQATSDNDINANLVFLLRNYATLVGFPVCQTPCQETMGLQSLSAASRSMPLSCNSTIELRKERGGYFFSIFLAHGRIAVGEDHAAIPLDSHRNPRIIHYL